MKNKSTNNSARLKENQREYRRLRQELLKVGYLWTGTVLRRSMTCGRQGCRCQRAPRFRHGSYYYWTRKVKGKTVSRLLTPKEGKLYKSWVANRQQLHKTLTKMYTVSRRVARLMHAQASIG